MCAPDFESPEVICNLSIHIHKNTAMVLWEDS